MHHKNLDIITSIISILWREYVDNQISTSREIQLIIQLETWHIFLKAKYTDNKTILPPNTNSVMK